MPDTKITINNNGPILVQGEFEVLDPQGNAFGLAGRKVVGLCRCGLSQNKPFCDGAHKNGFSDSVTARDLPAPTPKA